MSTQALTKSATHCPFVFSLPVAVTTLGQPVYAISLDYGFDFDQEELGRALLAPLPPSLGELPIHHVEAQEFESLYHWFNS